ncbi:L-threonylcarbamoyladenylate synthase [Psychrobacter sp. HD31]|uniref:L-threonylcarbamoyladenylate synthase n=1 Tax=Psychrobacter sp. HD31 TaxID=3112003 RepID=UPI003DA29D8A
MQTLYIHPDNPQPRLIQQVAEALTQDKLVIYPTDTSYAFACKIGSKQALNKLKQIRQLEDKHQFALMCHDLSEIAKFATVSNQQYKILKANTPNPITFILAATKDLPKKLAHPKKKTIGIRVPSNPIAQAILQQMGEPILTSTLILPEHDTVLDDPFEIEELLFNQADMLVNAGIRTTKLTTIIDLSDSEAKLIRTGAINPESIIF